MALFARLIYQSMPPRECLTRLHSTRVYARLLSRECVLSSSYAPARYFSTQPQLEETPSSPPPESFESIYKDLDELLNTTKYVKASNVNKLFYKCNTLDQLQQAKDILARFRKSPSHSRYSVGTVVVGSCVEMGAPEEAIEMAMDPVKYGIFPGKRACVILFKYYMDKLDMKGIEKTMEIKKMNELPFGGIEHFFMAKIMAIQLFEEKQVEGGKDEEEEGRSGDGGGEEEGGSGDGGGVEEGRRIGGDAGEKLTIENMKPVLDMCMEAYHHSSHNHGSRAVYYVHGRALSKGLTHLSSQMIEYLQTEGGLPEEVVLMLRLDRGIATNDVSGVLSLLETVQEKEVRLTFTRFKRLTNFFDENENIEAQKQFRALKLGHEEDKPKHRTPSASLEQEQNTYY